MVDSPCIPRTVAPDTSVELNRTGFQANSSLEAETTADTDGQPRRLSSLCQEKKGESFSLVGDSAYSLFRTEQQKGAGSFFLLSKPRASRCRIFSWPKKTEDTNTDEKAATAYRPGQANVVVLSG